MAGEKDKKGFSGLLDLASTISEINEPIKPEPKEEAIKDSDVKKESREASQNAGVSIDPSRALPPPSTVNHEDSDESEAAGVNISFGLMFALLIAICLFLLVFNSGNKVKSDRVLTSSKMDGNTREKRLGDDAGLMDIPTDTPSQSTPLNKDLSQQNGSRQNSQGHVVLPKAQTESSAPGIEIQSPSRNGRTEEKLLFGENGKGKARLVRVDNGYVVLSDGSRYPIIGLSVSDFSHLMRNYNAKSIGFQVPIHFIDRERTWWDRTLNYSRTAKLFAKSGTTIILLSHENKYHKIEYSNLSANDRSYIDSIPFFLPLNDVPFVNNGNPFDQNVIPDPDDPFNTAAPLLAP